MFAISGFVLIVGMLGICAWLKRVWPVALAKPRT
jgi:hypothetical protein